MKIEEGEDKQLIMKSELEESPKNSSNVTHK